MLVCVLVNFNHQQSFEKRLWVFFVCFAFSLLDPNQLLLAGLFLWVRLMSPGYCGILDHFSSFPKYQFLWPWPLSLFLIYFYWTMLRLLQTVFLFPLQPPTPTPTTRSSPTLPHFPFCGLAFLLMKLKCLCVMISVFGCQTKAKGKLLHYL